MIEAAIENRTHAKQCSELQIIYYSSFERRKFLLESNWYPYNDRESYTQQGQIPSRKYKTQCALETYREKFILDKSSNLLQTGSIHELTIEKLKNDVSSRFKLIDCLPDLQHYAASIMRKLVLCGTQIERCFNYCLDPFQMKSLTQPQLIFDSWKMKSQSLINEV